MSAINGSDNFCAKYLGNSDMFPNIKSQTINILCKYGFNCFETFISLDSDLDFPLIKGINLGQKALLRKAINLLTIEYKEHKFDYNNENQLNEAFDRIKEKIVYERNCAQNVLKEKIVGICDHNNENNSNNTLNLNQFKTKVMDINLDLDVSKEELISIDFNNKDVNDENISSNNGSAESDPQVDDTDWLSFKSSVNESEYEKLRETISSPIISLKRCQ